MDQTAANRRHGPDSDGLTRIWKAISDMAESDAIVRECVNYLSVGYPDLDELRDEIWRTLWTRVAAHHDPMVCSYAEWRLIEHKMRVADDNR